VQYGARFGGARVAFFRGTAAGAGCILGASDVRSNVAPGAEPELSKQLLRGR